VYDIIPVGRTLRRSSREHDVRAGYFPFFVVRRASLYYARTRNNTIFSRAKKIPRVRDAPIRPTYAPAIYQTFRFRRTRTVFIFRSHESRPWGPALRTHTLPQPTRRLVHPVIISFVLPFHYYATRLGFGSVLGSEINRVFGYAVHIAASDIYLSTRRGDSFSFP